MKHTANWTSLDRAIKDYIGQAEITTAKYLKLWQLGIRGLEELGMDVSESPRTRKLNINPNKTVDLPGDYLQWVKVGVLNEKGEVATLRRNLNLSKYADVQEDRLEANGDDINTGLTYFRNYQEGECYFNLFGVPSGTQNLGEFDIDDVQGIVLLDSNYSFDHIILEYIASPISDKTYLFPIQMRECLIAWLDFMNEVSLPQGRRSNNQRIQMKESRYLKLKKLARRRINPFRISEANDTIRLNNRLTLKA